MNQLNLVKLALKNQVVNHFNIFSKQLLELGFDFVVANAHMMVMYSKFKYIYIYI